jgi:hypothetical protein
MGWRSRGLETDSDTRFGTRLRPNGSEPSSDHPWVLNILVFINMI